MRTALSLLIPMGGLAAAVAFANPASSQLLPRQIGFPNTSREETNLRKAAANADSAVRALRDRARTIREQASAVAAGGVNVSATVAAMRQFAGRRYSEAEQAVTESSSHAQQIAAFIALKGAAQNRLAEVDADIARVRERIAAFEQTGTDPQAPERITLPRELEQLLVRKDRAQSEISDANSRLTQLNTEKTALDQLASSARTEGDNIRSAADSLASGNKSGAAGNLTDQATAMEHDAEQQSNHASGLRQQADRLNALLQRTVLPVRGRDDAQAFFNQYSTVAVAQNANLALGSKPGVGTVSVEYASGFIGPVRFAATGIVAKVDDDALTATEADVETARNRFYAGGGGTVISATMPILYSRYGPATAVIQGLARGVADLSPFALVGRRAHEVPLSGQVGGDGYITIGSEDVRLFLLGQASYVAISNRRFIESVGVEDQRFGHLEGAAGIEFKNGFRILGTWVNGPGDLHREFTFTVQLSPGSNAPPPSTSH